MDQKMKRALFPLRGPRMQTMAWWPVSLVCAVVDGYHEAFFAAFLRDDPWTR